MAERPPARILIVDDEPAICRLVTQILKKAGHSCDTCENGARAIAKVKSCDYDLVVTDIGMPGMSGIELLKRIREARPDTAVILLTGVDNHETAVRALVLGAYGYVIKPFEENELLINVANALRRRELELERNHYEERLEREVREQTAEIRLAQEEIMLRLATATESHDHDTGAHIRRIGEYAAILARALGLSDRYTDDIRLAAPMHDVGKIGVDDAILRKAGKLTDGEFDHMKEHTLMGGRILKGSRITLLEMARDIALYHHEKWDGGGYPFGLRGKEIQLSSRIVAVCDVYDALVSKRVYRPAMPEHQALSIMKENREAHFDPQILDLFLDHLSEFHAIRR